MVPKTEQEIARRIGQFYLQKNEGDYDKTRQEILGLQITDLLFMYDAIYIYLNYPGKLIGRYGSNITALSKFLGKEVKIVENRDHILYHLIPQEELELENYY